MTSPKLGFLDPGRPHFLQFPQEAADTNFLGGIAPAGWTPESSILDDEAKSRLESRFCADDDKTTSATQSEERML